MAQQRTRTRHRHAGQRTLHRMPGIFFDEREMRFIVTENATPAELRRLAELVGMPTPLDAEGRAHS
jgi:hypothetical protein